MNFKLEIVNMLKDEEIILLNLKTKKLSALNISEEKSFLLECEKKQSYIVGVLLAELINPSVYIKLIDREQEGAFATWRFAPLRTAYEIEEEKEAEKLSKKITKEIESEKLI